MGKLAGKVAIITGGSRGMGRATVEVFTKEGARVIIADVLDAEGTALAQEMGDGAIYRHLDVSDERGWGDVARSAIDSFGRIDILVNNAAIFLYALIDETRSEAFRRLLDINVIGPYLGMKTVIPIMKKQRSGSIVNVSSTDGLRGSCGMGAYNASKWGVRGLTKCVAMEVGPFGIRVNSLHPGTVDTPMFNPHGLDRDALNASFGKQFPGVSLSRVGDPSEIARASLFLASDDASYVSGAELAVDGAWTCGVYLQEKPEPN
ncbi:oxidoreductase, short-chain dehydrogenase/reductase family [Geobacter metallireducens GS-15]|uniref:Oxidoreductase, short-chain dehydrogenase/reductase family n=1 Tax=Geobacter metallireducens (strain ATCC 53774 / DSM 7210 / GS-15) TaxID=269799 RepID=Q39TH1_GEOMG|nr:glucose 1-dehydrogenase [Geobacter metallireducens]ABB32453.1 oxidoreductase, short-chain dehydrogenase/reductase family [Geobacter metallireducens GS-15]